MSRSAHDVCPVGLARLIGVAALVFVTFLMLAAGPVRAASWSIWPSWLGRGPDASSTDLGSALAAIRGLPDVPDAPIVGVHATPEGHWQFVNRKGETFTAGTPAELLLAPQALVADIKNGFAGMALIASQESLFAGPTVLRDMPNAKSLSVVIGGEILPLRVSPRLSPAVILRPGVSLSADDKDGFLEALAQLRRPLDASRLRILSAATGGPATVATAPKFDAAQGGAAIDLVDPDRLADALASLTRQTAIVTARLDGANLTFQPPSGPERTLPLAALTTAAAAADADLLILHADPPRQPGGRNWLWQRIQVAGLEHATKRGTLADFLDQLASGRGSAFAVSIAPDGEGRVRLTAQPNSAAVVSTEGVTGWIKQAADAVTGQVTGAVQPASVHASLVSQARRSELSLRLVPGLPSLATAIYLGAAVLGLLGLPVVLRWWRKLWPAESRNEYANARGYVAARAIRAIAFFAVFLPIAAVPALLAKIVELIVPRKAQPL